MTGFEAAALGIGVPALKSAGAGALKKAASSAAQSLANKAGFRWKVWWRVRSRTNFAFQRRAYRNWLKSISPEELASPVEEVQGRLAMRLDQAFSSAATDWTTNPEHLSRALQLVEETYPQIAATLGGADSVALTATWGQQRGVYVRDRLLQLVGTAAALSTTDLAATLHHRSRARRAVRLQAFGVDELNLAAYFEAIEAPDVPDGRVVVLSGDFGSGKSETAEAWHRESIEDFVMRDGPIPLWLIARHLRGQTLEDAVNRQLASAWSGGRGASIVIDGLDETDPAVAQALLEDARVLSATYANVRVLLTARPGILSPTAAEEVSAVLLSEEEAIGLVEMAGGQPRDTWHWTRSMRATVTRPFFALAAGVMLGRNEAPRGEADLIRSLVEDALAKATERSAVTSADTRSALEQLAVALTRTGSDDLSFNDRQLARSSRLVADGPDSSILFSLPIFQHWFAAQAILAHTVPAAEVVADASSFNRWRWAAAVAALSATGAQEVDDLLATFVSGNPGAAAWIIKEAFSGRRDWRTEESGDLDAQTSGARLLRALRVWTDALGPLAVGVLPHPLVQGAVGLGVSISGHRINVAFSHSHPASDFVTEVPSGVHPIIGPVSGWSPWLTGAPPEGDAWPWTLVRKQIAEKTMDKLSRDPYLGAPEEVWVQERRFALARSLLGRSSHSALPVDEVRERAAALLAAWGPEATIRLSGSATLSGVELEQLISWIDTTSPAQISWQLPEADIKSPRGRLIWDLYSPQRLVEFELEVYSRACEAYDEALAHAFSGLGWSMPSSVLAPFGVILEVQSEAEGPRHVRGLTVMRAPLAMMNAITASGHEIKWSSSRRAAVTRITRAPSEDRERHWATLETISTWLAQQNREAFGGLGWTVAGADDMTNVRPASNLAVNWLWSDLKNIGLGDGTFPRVE